MTTYFDWDTVEDNIVEEFDDVGSTVADYTTEPYLYGDLVSQRRSGQSRFFHFDGLGSTTELTDNTGALTDTRGYSAFGVVTENIGNTLTSCLFAAATGAATDFTGCCIRRRHYQPSLATWRSKDPRQIRRALKYLPHAAHWILSTVRCDDPRQCVALLVRLRRSSIWAELFLFSGYDYCGNRPTYSNDPSGEQSAPPCHGRWRRLRLGVCEARTRERNPDYEIEYSDPLCTGAIDDYGDWNFAEACKTHDECYQTCGKTQGQCDDELKANLVNICERDAPPHRRRACGIYAEIYYRYVMGVFGPWVFPQSQDAACKWTECCCPEGSLPFPDLPKEVPPIG